MQQHPRHLVCHSDALLIGEKIPTVAPGEELQPGHAYFLLPAHLFHSVLSFVSLASSLLLLLSTAGARGGNKKQRPFELLRTASGMLQIMFSDDFLLVVDAAAIDDKVATNKPPVLCGDKKLEKEYEELVGAKGRSGDPVAGACAGEDTATETDSGEAEAEAALQESRRRDGENTGELGMATVQDIARPLSLSETRSSSPA
ncbi:hypothetical protein E2562_013162 [Oryza meyeriana var. granulata]|uniref:DUF4228 domain-containing protein n=1 Tax=Oryza meyeriana var. granulata TaxID=110450 RepID=A0A6G1DIA9_9ORYZ|nr:hypothetical protein E2562_013162 [Oryza meyeriana var. granulata]